jgi:PKD repeat protein
VCGAQWAWNFGDGGGAAVQNPLYEWKKADVYTVTLLVSNSAGSSTIQKSITVTNN